MRVRIFSVVVLLAVSALAQAGHNPPAAGSKVALAAVASPPACLGPLVTPGAPATATSCAAVALQSEEAPKARSRADALPHRVSLVKTIILAGIAAGLTGFIVWARAKEPPCHGIRVDDVCEAPPAP